MACLWLPRRDEFALARSLGLTDHADHESASEAIAAAAADLRERGVEVRVGRWHVWRVVRTLAGLGASNLPDHRAAAYLVLAREGGGHEPPVRHGAKQ